MPTYRGKFGPKLAVWKIEVLQLPAQRGFKVLRHGFTKGFPKIDRNMILAYFI